MAGFREFVTGEVLTAANVNSFLMRQSVMVFADGAARDSALGTAIAGGNALVEGMLTYNKDTEALEVYDGTAWGSVVTTKEKRIEAFTGSGTWTVPAGVTYAIAHMLGGGAGSYGRTASTTAVAGANGGASSVVFSDGTKTAAGGLANTNLGNGLITGTITQAGIDALANSGKQGGRVAGNSNVESVNVTGGTLTNFPLGDGVMITVGGPVVAASSVTVTVGAGGTGGGATNKGGDGGSGYVYIEYYEEV